MRTLAILATPFLGLSLALGAAEPKGRDCNLDADTRVSILALPFATFDQTEGSGWRPLYEKRCYKEAADLILEYMPQSRAPASQQYILPFHMGQMLALAGQSEIAIEYMQRSYQRTPQTLINWNAYVAATIAFLSKDRGELMRQRELIDQQPLLRPSPGLPEAMVGKKMNLDVVDRFIACFEDTYEVAFRDGCDAPSGSSKSD